MYSGSRESPPRTGAWIETGARARSLPGGAQRPPAADSFTSASASGALVRTRKSSRDHTSRARGRPVAVNDAPQLLGPQHHVEVPHPEPAQRVDRRGDDAGCRADGPRLADPLGPERIDGRRGHGVVELEAREVAGARRRRPPPSSAVAARRSPGRSPASRCGSRTDRCCCSARRTPRRSAPASDPRATWSACRRRRPPRRTTWPRPA